MNFTDFTIRLAQQQLKNLSIVDDFKEGTLKPDAEDAILNLANQGLQDITTRIKMFEGRGSITFVAGQNIYDISGFANYVKILTIFDEDELIYNPKTSAHITLPSPKTIRFSDKFMEDKTAVDVLYHASHAEITLTDDIDLPPNLIEALALYVAGLYISHMGSPEHTQKGDSYYGLYLNMLSTDEERNTSGASEVVDEDARFADRGFV